MIIFQENVLFFSFYKSLHVIMLKLWKQVVIFMMIKKNIRYIQFSGILL